MPSDATNEMTRREWRELGFFYDCDHAERVWRLIGSRSGLLGFVDLLRSYARNPRNAPESEHDHYGPYMYLTLVTSREPGMDGRAIRGKLPDFERLATILAGRLSEATPGSIVRIREDFAADSPYSLVLEVRQDDFDPATADSLLTESGERSRT